MIKTIKNFFGGFRTKRSRIYKVDSIKIYSENREDSVFARQYNFFVIAQSRLQAQQIAHKHLDSHQEKFGPILGVVELNPSNIYEVGYYDIHEHTCIDIDFKYYL